MFKIVSLKRTKEIVPYLYDGKNIIYLSNNPSSKSDILHTIVFDLMREKERKYHIKVKEIEIINYLLGSNISRKQSVEAVISKNVGEGNGTDSNDLDEVIKDLISLEKGIKVLIRYRENFWQDNYGNVSNPEEEEKTDEFTSFRENFWQDKCRTFPDLEEEETDEFTRFRENFWQKDLIR